MVKVLIGIFERHFVVSQMGFIEGPGEARFVRISEQKMDGTAVVFVHQRGRRLSPSDSL